MTNSEETINIGDEITELSDYLTKLKKEKKLNQISLQEIQKIFRKISKKIEPNINSKFSDTVAECFLFNLNNLIMEIDDHLCTDNHEMLHTMVKTTYLKIFDFVQNGEKSGIPITNSTLADQMMNNYSNKDN